jgi:hypothetical protein
MRPRSARLVVTTSGVVVGPHEIALVHHQRARAPGDRRANRRVLELHLRILQRRLVGIHSCVERGRRRLRGIDLLAGRDASLRQFLEPLGLLRGVGGLGDIAIEIGLGLLRRSGGRRSSVDSTCPAMTSSPSV